MKNMIKASMESAAVKESIGIPTSLDTVVGRVNVIDFTKSNGVFVVLGQFVDTQRWVVAWNVAKRENGNWSWQQGHYFMDDAQSAQTFFKKRYVDDKKVPDEWGKVI
jgi:hypothetical protein